MIYKYHYIVYKVNYLGLAFPLLHDKDLSLIIFYHISTNYNNNLTNENPVNQPKQYIIFLLAEIMHV